MTDLVQVVPATPARVGVTVTFQVPLASDEVVQICIDPDLRHVARLVAEPFVARTE